VLPGKECKIEVTDSLTCFSYRILSVSIQTALSDVCLYITLLK